MMFEIVWIQEIVYLFKFGQQVYVELYSVFDGWSFVGIGFQGEFVMQEDLYIEKWYVFECIDCMVIFYVNVEGIISYFEYIGDLCGWVFRYWGRLKW